MPFTTYHLASGLLVGFLLKRYVYWPSLLVATVVVDVEPLLALLRLARNYPLHGYLHTYLASVVLGLAVGYFIYATRALTHSPFRYLYLAEEEPTATSSSLGGVVGWALHVSMDSPIYSDIRPLLPAQYNPLYVGYSTGLQVLWDAILVCGLVTYFTHLYRTSRESCSRAGELQLGVVMVLAGLLVIPMGFGEGLYVDSRFHVLVGGSIALAGLALATRFFATLKYLSRAKSWLTLVLAIVAVALLSTSTTPYVTGYTVLISWALLLAIALLLRKPLNRLNLRLLKLPFGDLLIVSCALLILVAGVPLLLLALLLLAVKVGKLCEVSEGLG